MYKSRIRELEYQHTTLDNEIDTLERTGVFDDAQMQSLKRQRLACRDELSRLRRLQWDLDHESVDLEDDR